MELEIKIKMEEGAEDLFPTKAHSSDAAWDLRARRAVLLIKNRGCL